ncbi:cyclase family protein [Lutibacter sp. HS1-25]|uniref:cyclase family protein n=1 Tax=Lutibacter sp. HS1-25 TaxID=2485000 RepID=UPI001010F369|nr:cyclase family protein [Lutibacter sp. HS1-25]RXP46459.1 cyclase family protein [Lutibacter sp. HS1-25]
MIKTGKNKIIDLTRVIAHGDSGVELETAKTIGVDGWNAKTLHLYSHSGTHMDAPIHFEVNEQTIDNIVVNRFLGKAWVVDLSNVQPGHLITISDLGEVANKLNEGESLLIKTGWNAFFGTSKFRDELPRISKDLALWCGKKKVNMLGVEPPSVADVNNINEVTEIHQILMKNDIIIIEGLVNLEQIKSSTVTLIALPLKVKNGDGAPARVIAIED